MVALAAAAGPRIRIETPPDGRHRVSVIGLDAAQLGEVRPAAARALAVYAGVIGPETPAVAGTYETDAEGLHFAPLFRFSPGVDYTARVRIGPLRLERAFRLEAPTVDPPRVSAVYPSGETLPANALRLYVHFSRPMSIRDSTTHVRLLDPDGQEVPLAFVPVEGGLWDPDHTRLTLLFHPGRVKRGVAPGERMGPPLRAGREYRLVVAGAMTDANGIPLQRAFEHRFRAVEADREPPRTDRLAIEAPSTPTAPLSVRLPEPLDHALLARWVWIEDERGRRVEGSGEARDGEARWVFQPAAAWAPGHYLLRIERALEDRAGNRFDRAFDREPGAGMPAASDPLRLPFDVR